MIIAILTQQNAIKFTIYHAKPNIKQKLNLKNKRLTDYYSPVKLTDAYKCINRIFSTVYNYYRVNT